jgi:triacylglycerol lipase
VKLEQFRWVNNNDIVTRMPPTWLGYRHSGNEIYLDRSGQIQKIFGWRRVSDRLQGFLGGLLKFRLDQLSDHSVVSYIDRIFNLVRNEKNNPSTAKAADKTEPSASSNPAAKASA